MSSQPTAYIKEEAVADLGFGDKDRFVEENGLADAVALAQEDSKWSRGGPSKHAAGWEKDDRETFVPPKPTIQPVVELDLDDGDILVITNEQMVSDRTEKIMRDLILDFCVIEWRKFLGRRAGPVGDHAVWVVAANLA